jgi:hypothetical protein
MENIRVNYNHQGVPGSATVQKEGSKYTVLIENKASFCITPDIDDQNREAWQLLEGDADPDLVQTIGAAIRKTE